MSAAVVVFLIGSFAPAQDALRDPWDGFAAGSWVEYSQSTNNRVTHVYRSTREPWDAPAAPEAGLVLTGRRDDRLIIGDRRLDCEVLQYAGPDDTPSRWVSLVLWKARGLSLPPREVWNAPRFCLSPDVVKLQRCELRGAQVTSLSLDLVDPDCLIAVAGKTYRSVMEDVFTVTTAPDRPTSIRGRRRWICDAIPGRIARRDETCITGTGGGYYTVEATDFKALR